MSCSIIALSSISQILYRLERFCHNSLDSIWISFIISIIFFVLLLAWAIAAAVLNKRQETIVNSAEPLRPLIPSDPFVKSSTDIYQRKEDSGFSNYLISSTGSEEEVDLMDAESKLYELSLVNDNKDTSPPPPGYDIWSSESENKYDTDDYSLNVSSNTSREDTFDPYGGMSSSFEDKSSFYMSHKEKSLPDKPVSLSFDSQSGRRSPTEDDFPSESRVLQSPGFSDTRDRKPSRPQIDLPPPEGFISDNGF